VFNVLCGDFLFYKGDLPMAILNRNEAMNAEAYMNSKGSRSNRDANWALEQAICDSPDFVLERMDTLTPEEVGIPADVFNEYHAFAKAMANID
jgi:hypothetical protein